MKKTLIILLACLVLLSFISCKDEDEWIVRGEGNEIISSQDDEKEPENAEDEVLPEEQEEPKESKEEIKALSDAAAEKLSVIPEYPEGYPNLDDVVAQYERANEAVGWIINTSYLATEPSDTHKAHGLIYQRVLPDCHYGDMAGESEDNEKLIYTRDNLEAYLSTLIHPDEAHDYMIDLKEGYEVPRITAASNGALYALTFPYYPEGYGKKDEYELVDNGDGSYTFIVKYTTINDEDVEEGPFTQKFGYENVDGRWVFTNFRVIKQ